MTVENVTFTLKKSLKMPYCILFLIQWRKGDFTLVSILWRLIEQVNLSLHGFFNPRSNNGWFHVSLTWATEIQHNVFTYQKCLRKIEDFWSLVKYYRLIDCIKLRSFSLHSKQFCGYLINIKEWILFLKHAWSVVYNRMLVFV